jgi:Alcohol dehydrogenase GroES-like domain
MTSRLNPYQAAPELMKLFFALDAIGHGTDHAQLNVPDASLGRAGGHSPGYVAATPGVAEALIRVKAAGVAPWDAWIQTGKSTLPQPLPLTLGPDISGVVEGSRLAPPGSRKATQCSA